MSTSRDERYYSSRSTPPVVDSHQSSVFFQGQGGRTVLPPISSAFPNSLFPVPVPYSNQFSQPRSSPPYNQAVYNQWPGNNTATTSSQQQSSFYYDHHDSNRYPPSSNYPSYNAPRTPPSMTGTPVDPRKLPPLATSTYPRDERWNPSYPATPPPVPATTTHIRSPTASYPANYPGFPHTGPNYNYSSGGVHHHHPQQHSTLPASSTLATAMQPRSGSPYGHNASHVSSSPPVSPTFSEEPSIKKKRKRADAAQLKILTETYNRTAFPSTEERMELAKKLDMTPRSVQIWFQNRRQSMRQTRQSTASASTQQAFSLTTQPESIDDSAGYDMPVPPGSYMPPASHPSPTLTSAHRRVRSQDAVPIDPRKPQWPRAY